MSIPGLEGEDLLKNIRQLVFSFDPHIREAGSMEQVEEALIHMEENDQNFHKIDFVKHIKRNIEECVGRFVDEEMEDRSNLDSHRQETLVNDIARQVINSPEYISFVKTLKANMTEAVRELQQNFDKEFGGGMPHLEDTTHSRITPLVTDDEEVASCDSMFAQGSVMMFDPDYMRHISESLSRSQSIQSRREALQKMNQIMSADILNHDFWPQLRRNILDVLADSDHQLSMLSLKFIAKSFTCTTHQTREIFVLLTDHLHSLFTSKHSQISMVQSGLDITRPENVKVIKAFRLLNEFQQEAPNYWIRYPDRYHEEIIESSLNLYACQQTSSSPSPRLSPLHFVAVVDPKAQWFIKWMHGNYSRKTVLGALKKHHQIVESAVRHCLDFSAARKQTSDMMSDTLSDAMSRVSVNGRRLVYTGPEMDYLYFMHSVCFLGRLLCFVNGRKLFPVKLKDKYGSVTVAKLLKALALLIVDPSPSASSPKHFGGMDSHEPASLAAEVFKGLCSCEQVCETCLCNSDIISTLLTPVQQFLDGSCTELYSPSEDTLLHVADIISMVASSTRGRRYLMYGEGRGMFTRTKSSAAHVIAEFTKKALLEKLPLEDSPYPSRQVVGAYLYICRQLYNTCEGLLVLYPYELHTCVAEAWRQASQEAERAPTPTPSDRTALTSSTTQRDLYNVRFWEDTLRDNLLNFASTAKGILLLQQTGAINECVFYMHTRYEKKLQVSKCEKFGYGCMVTQVAATAPGMMALQNTGYIKALICELWASLECGPDDIPLIHQKKWPVDIIDRAAHKNLIRLLNILSAFPAVYEVLANKPLPVRENYGFRDIPDSIIGLIDRLVMVDSPAKIHSLFNYEQSHAFGLRLLSVMVSCLDTFLLLQSQYRFQEALLSAQSDNHPGDSDTIIYDSLSLERNYILVKTYLVGGPSERVLPPQSIQEVSPGKEMVFPYPLFSSYPVPREYSPNLAGRSAMKQDNELSKFLTSQSEKKSPVWLEKCRTIFAKILTNKPEHTKGTLLQQLLERSVAVMCEIPEEAIFPDLQFSGSDSAVKNFQLSSLQQLGIKIAVRYGIHLKVINTSSDATDSLGHLLKLAGTFLGQQQKSLVTPLRYMESGYSGFDWFAATIFLLFHGHQERAWGFLQRFSCLAASGYLWMPRLHGSVHLPPNLTASGIPVVFSSTAHNIEFVLQVELPTVASAFKMSGYTPAQICVHWLKQCFWNYLDWLDVCHYVCTCVVMGVDYQVYMCVAVLKHLQQLILTHMQTQDLVILLREEPIRDFHISNYMKYMRELENKYRKTVLQDMLTITKP